MTTRWEWRGVLAAAYRVSRVFLDHLVLVSRDPFVAGRITRRHGETLCRRVPPEHMADIGSGSPDYCPRCVDMAARLFKAPPHP